MARPFVLCLLVLLGIGATIFPARTSRGAVPLIVAAMLPYASTTYSYALPLPAG